MNRLLLAALLLPAVAHAADDFTAADRTIRVRGILNQHCAECHGETPGAGRLSVVDHLNLLQARPVAAVQPKDAAASQLVALVEDGSMPPGNRPKLSAADVGVLRGWVADGAGFYPVRFRDEFAWQVIAADAAKLSPGELAVTRYLTMHHLVGDGDFAPTRAKVLGQVRRLIRPAATGPAPADPTGTVFRLNTAAAGWNHQPFVEVDAKFKITDTKVQADVFDVFLLDYPFGRFPAGTPLGDALAKNFLDKAGMKRPVPFVHADWFAHLLTGTPLGKDIAQLVTPNEKDPPEGLTAAAGRLPAPRPPAGDDQTAVPAVDAWTAADFDAKKSAIDGLEFYLMDSKTGKKTTAFRPDDQLKLHIKADVPIYFEVLWVDGKNALNVWHKNTHSLLPSRPYEEDFPPEGVISDELGKERLTLFVSTHNFVPGQAWRSRVANPNGIDRFAHAFGLLQVKDGRYAYQPSSVGVERHTIEITITK